MYTMSPYEIQLLATPVFLLCITVGGIAIAHHTNPRGARLLAAVALVNVAVIIDMVWEVVR